MSDADVHAFNHDAILGRLRSLSDGQLTGRQLLMTREMFAYSIVGHDLVWPDCHAAALIPTELRLPL